ncbi:MAG: penicillin-binding protein activator [Proteobacteria bacterium]|nr:penicillin-binding protein activator [Pseudomonadota bacterium]
MVSRRGLPLMFCCIAVVIAGCAQIGAPREEAPDAVAADHDYAQGNFDAAAQDFLALADAHPRDGAFYRLRAAEAYLQNGEIDAVAKTLPDIRRHNLQGDEPVRYDLLAAEVALSHHDPAGALKSLHVADADLATPLRMRALELRARAQAAQGDALDSARTRADLDRLLGGNDRAQNEAQIVATLKTMAPDALRNEAAALLPGDALRPWIDQALRAGGGALPVVVLHPNQPVGTLIPQGQQPPQREGYAPAHKIALLLPESGPLMAVAQPVRDGFFAAYFADTNAQRAPVTVYDSGGGPADAVAAYQKAVADGADRIVGPLARDAVAAVFAQGNLPVPVLALNQPDGAQSPPHGSAAFGLNPDAEAAQAAEHMLQQGIRRAVVITATEDWAERAALAFRAQFEAGNGQVLGEARVTDNQVNYADMIRQTLSGVPTSGAAPALPGAAPIASDAPTAAPVDTGIFISMRPQQARLLLPQLKLAGYTGVPVFATSHIFAGNYNPGLDRDLDGVQFCDAPWLFDATLGLPNHDAIVRALDSARGAGGRLFAMGMDAYRLLPYMDWLAQHPDSYLPGATGQLAEDRLGRIQRLLTWAQFDNGAAHPVAGSLQTSAAPAQ